MRLGMCCVCKSEMLNMCYKNEISCNKITWDSYFVRLMEIFGSKRFYVFFFWWVLLAGVKFNWNELISDFFKSDFEYID